MILNSLELQRGQTYVFRFLISGVPERIEFHILDLYLFKIRLKDTGFSTIR